MSSNFPRRSQRKKQTRLMFQRVEPSSSTTISPARLHHQPSSSGLQAFDLASPIQTRDDESDVPASNKNYSVIIDTPKKQKKDGRLPFKPLTTPVESLRMQTGPANRNTYYGAEDSDSDLEIIPTYRRRHVSVKSAFSQPLISALPRYMDLSLLSDGTSSFVSGHKKKRSMGYDGAEDDSSAGSSPEDEVHTPSKNKKKATPTTPKPKQAASPPITVSDGDESPETVLPTPRRTRGSSHRNKSKVVDNDESEDIFSLPQSSLSRSRRESNNTLEEDSSDEDDLPHISAITASSGRNRKRAATFANREQLWQDDEDDEDVVITPVTKRRRLIIEEDDEIDVDTSPSKRVRPGSKSQDKAQRKVDISNDKQSKRLTRQQQHKKHHRSAREKKIELLRRQRAGEKISKVTSSESSDDELRPALYDKDSEHEALSEFDDDEEEEDQLIDNDGDELLGVPTRGVHAIPHFLTNNAHKPLKEHFKDAIEWMVQNKINPAFNREDGIYVQAFKKLEREVGGYADSRYTSSVWKPNFTRALRARPVIYVTALGLGDENNDGKCDACGRSNHPAKYLIQFGGKAYHKSTLEEVDKHPDDDDDESDVASVNSNGMVISSESEQWYVGSVCKANAEQAHSLIHWKHALNEWVIDSLKKEGQLDAAKLAERDGWSKKEKCRYANKLVDEWEKGNTIMSLYRDFKSNLEAARQNKHGRWGK